MQDRYIQSQDENPILQRIDGILQDARNIWEAKRLLVKAVPVLGILFVSGFVITEDVSAEQILDEVKNVTPRSINADDLLAENRDVLNEFGYSPIFQTEGQGGEPPIRKGMVGGNGVNVRADAGTTFPVIESISHTDSSGRVVEFDILSEKEGNDGRIWLEVLLANGETGFIRSDLVIEVEPTFAAVPEAPAEIQVGTDTPNDEDTATEPAPTEEGQGAGATETPIPLFKATEAPALKWWDFTCRVVGIDESPHTVGDLTTALSLVCEYQISPTEMAQIPIAIAVNSSDGYMIFGFQPKQGKEVTSYYAQSILEQKIGGSLIGRTMTVSVGLPSASNSGVISVPFVSSAIQSEYTIEGMTDFVSGVSAGNLSSLGTDTLLPLYLTIS